jgi:hypothetical protein
MIPCSISIAGTDNFYLDPDPNFDSDADVERKYVYVPLMSVSSVFPTDIFVIGVNAFAGSSSRYIFLT